MEKLGQIWYQISKFLLPGLFLIVGIYLLQIALVPKVETLNNGQPLEVPQSSLFMYAALLFLVGGIVWLLYVMGLIKSLVGRIVMVLMVGLSVYVLYEDFTTIKTDVDYKNKYERTERDIFARIDDIKSAQIAYKELNGHYTNNMDDLITFVKEGKKMVIKKDGAVPERKIYPEERDLIYGDDRPIDKLMTETEAWLILEMSENPPADLKGFVRDTSYVSVMDAIFNDISYLENRDKTGCHLDFHPDSLRYIPYSKNLVEMDTGFLAKGDSGEIKVPTLEIVMIHPMDTAKIYQIGDKNDSHLRENWKK